MVSQIKNSVRKIRAGERFTFPFQGENTLWQVGESLGDRRWACRIVDGTFMGTRYTNIYHGQEAAFDEDHIQACMDMDTQMVRVASRLGRMAGKKGPRWQKATSSSGQSATEATST